MTKHLKPPIMDYDDACGEYLCAMLDEIEVRMQAIKAASKSFAAPNPEVEPLADAIIELALPINELAGYLMSHGSVREALAEPHLRVFDRLDPEVRLALENPPQAA